MWNKYTKNHTDTVCIETTTGLLKSSFTNKSLPIIFEYIRYFEDPFFNQETYWFPSLFKKKEYDFEKEFRCMIFADNLYNSTFIKLEVSLSKLIKNIYLHPDAS